jgi:hypothetical protein
VTLNRLFQILGAVATLSLFGCYALGGWKGAAGYALGLFATGFGIVVWQLVISILANVAESNPKPRTGSTLVVLAFLFKLPLFVAAVFLAVKIGGIARGCFAVGLVQVYLALVGRLFTRDAVRPT